MRNTSDSVIDPKQHAVQGKYGIYWSLNEVDSIQRILDHLLDQGCDPNSFYGPLTHRRL